MKKFYGQQLFLIKEGEIYTVVYYWIMEVIFYLRSPTSSLTHVSVEAMLDIGSSSCQHQRQFFFRRILIKRFRYTYPFHPTCWPTNLSSVNWIGGHPVTISGLDPVTTSPFISTLWQQKFLKSLRNYSK